jgi:hypothetical protein
MLEWNFNITFLFQVVIASKANPWGDQGMIKILLLFVIRDRSLFMKGGGWKSFFSSITFVHDPPLKMFHLLFDPPLKLFFLGYDPLHTHHTRNTTVYTHTFCTPSSAHCTKSVHLVDQCPTVRPLLVPCRGPKRKTRSKKENKKGKKTEKINGFKQVLSKS